MSLWTVVDVGSIKVPVHFRARTHDEVVAGTLGQFDKINCEIFVGDDLSRDMAKATLFHEYGHAVAWIYGIDCGDDEEEEKKINLFASIVFDVLTRNGLLNIPDPPTA